jgi:hypothetical protein
MLKTFSYNFVHNDCSKKSTNNNNVSKERITQKWHKNDFYY